MKPLSPEEYLVNTVDSFQGNEAGVVVVSLVRNNRHRMPKAFGFLGEDERMNVLFSRAERLLVLVGSWDFFQANLEHISPDPDDLDPLASWRRAVDYLSDCFDDGRGIKIAVNELPEVGA